MPAPKRPVPIPGWKDCLDCGKAQTLDAFHQSKKGSQGVASYCKPCFKVRQRDWLGDRPGYSASYGRGRRRRAIETLGGCCVRCGITDIRVLDIDHVFGDGRIERAKTRSAHVTKVIQDPDSGRYQVLCANCHRIKTWEAGENGCGGLCQEAA